MSVHHSVICLSDKPGSCNNPDGSSSSVAPDKKSIQVSVFLISVKKCFRYSLELLSEVLLMSTNHSS